jgi:hypothetical protein
MEAPLFKAQSTLFPILMASWHNLFSEKIKAACALYNLSVEQVAATTT